MILTLKKDQKVPADCILTELIDSPSLTVREVAITGELDDFEKIPLTANNYERNPCPFIVAGSYIMEGKGKALVCSVGKCCRN